MPVSGAALTASSARPTIIAITASLAGAPQVLVQHQAASTAVNPTPVERIPSTANSANCRAATAVSTNPNTSSEVPSR